jgi:hypothetical protein
VVKDKEAEPLEVYVCDYYFDGVSGVKIDFSGPVKIASVTSDEFGYASTELKTDTAGKYEITASGDDILGSVTFDEIVFEVKINIKSGISNNYSLLDNTTLIPLNINNVLNKADVSIKIIPDIEEKINIILESQNAQVANFSGNSTINIKEGETVTLTGISFGQSIIRSYFDSQKAGDDANICVFLILMDSDSIIFGFNDLKSTGSVISYIWLEGGEQTLIITGSILGLGSDYASSYISMGFKLITYPKGVFKGKVSGDVVGTSRCVGSLAVSILSEASFDGYLSISNKSKDYPGQKIKVPRIDPVDPLNDTLHFNLSLENTNTVNFQFDDNGSSTLDKPIIYHGGMLDLNVAMGWSFGLSQLWIPNALPDNTFKIE